MGPYFTAVCGVFWGLPGLPLPARRQMLPYDLPSVTMEDPGVAVQVPNQVSLLFLIINTGKIYPSQGTKAKSRQIYFVTTL